jgi:flagellar protein FlaG
MDISSYTSNVQPYGLSGGTNIASSKESTLQTIQQVEKERETALEKSNASLKQEPALPISDEERDALFVRINEFVDSMNTGLSFRIDEDTGKEVVTIYDAKTGDTLRQFPSEDMLEVLKRLSEHSTGLIAESV